MKRLDSELLELHLRMNINILILVCFGYIFVVANCDDGIEGNTIDNLSDEEKYINDLVQKALEFGVMEFKNENALNRLKTKEGVDTKADSAENQLSKFGDLNEDSTQLVDNAKIQLAALKKLFITGHIKPNQIKAKGLYLQIWKKWLQHYCQENNTKQICDPNAYYRTIDGTCNNLEEPTWGAVMCPQSREIPPMYSDGIDAPRRFGVSGEELPSARVISNELHKADGQSPRNDKLTMMVMQWGQFIDHDIVSTPVMKGAMGANIECCGEGNENRTECFSIRIPADDPFFSRTCMGLVRSAPAPEHNCEPGSREQMNQVTSYIDASAIYGSTENQTISLRAFKGGLLKFYEDNEKRSEQLPPAPSDKCTIEAPEDHCTMAGDKRVNVVPSLGWSHTCFMREHNRIAQELGRINPDWDDETIFQQTRRIMAAIIQIINYKEYLPAILNKDTMDKYKLNLFETTDHSDLYRADVNPSIINAFAAAAFRFGHSQIADYQALMSKQYQFTKKKPIETTYHRPHMIQVDGAAGLDGIARWLVDDPTPLADGIFGDGVRNLLFKDKKGKSLDLPALNIQRGRDHGLPGYNQWRIHCNLVKADMTNDGSFILPDHNEKQKIKIQNVYSHVDDIDLFAGAMTETLLPDSSVGPTFACLLGKQFKKLRIGDRYWHETNNPIIRFTNDQLTELRKVSFARVLCDNFDFSQIQPDVFHVPGTENERVDCGQIPGMNLGKWASSQFLSDGRPNFTVSSRKKRNQQWVREERRKREDRRDRD
ncbi:peroxidase-like [Ruditapes philippinarum]|uniref:peroxidase-like n=1 Tax=Ruditapes philippinarum TaxID=129788 RepID=UPI00295C23C8|nr:peroxidase-like [Ruditapes philippinarum]